MQPYDQKNLGVLLFAGLNDRAMITAIRSFENHGINYHISLPTSGKVTKLSWNLTPYRENIIESRYDNSCPDTLLRSIEQIQKEIGNFAIFPIGSRSLEFMTRFTDRLEDMGVILPLPPRETFTKMSQKGKFYQTIQEYGLNSPKQYNGSDVTPPVVAKPKAEVSESGEKISTKIIRNNIEWERFKRKNDTELFVFQEYIRKVGHHYRAYWEEGSLIDSIGRLRTLQQPNGMASIKAIPKSVPHELEYKINNMLSDLRWTGMISIEFVEYEGDYYLFEANPRFTGSTPFDLDNGYDFPAAMYDTVAGSNFYNTPTGKPNAGFKWSAGYLRGFWQKLFYGGDFRRANIDPPNVKYKDVWARSDTIYNHFIFDLVLQGLLPVSEMLSILRNIRE